MFELTNKVAVITGGGSGIGQAIALLFAKQGAQVVVLDIDDTARKSAVEQIRVDSGKAISLHCDVSNAEEVRQVFRTIDAEFHRIDILVNNAGIAHVGDVAHTAENDFDHVYGVNV